MKVAIGIVGFCGFDWDEANVHKVRRHRVETFVIEEFFTRKLLYFPDHKHSQHEKRYLAYGTTFEGRHLIVAFTMRNKNGENNIRVITARYMHKKEITVCEKIKKASEG